MVSLGYRSCEHYQQKTVKRFHFCLNLYVAPAISVFLCLDTKLHNSNLWHASYSPTVALLSLNKRDISNWQHAPLLHINCCTNAAGPKPLSHGWDVFIKTVKVYG
uniref:Uncharacterized protein n=1 Tax=Solanum lycopersicum TaxID=4081 RepID=A0A3Q7HZ95_SOLLC